MVEFQDKDFSIFNEVMALLKGHNDFERLYINDEAALSIPNLEIYPQQRKIYYNEREIHLTTKEYNILCLLAVNKNHVLTYEQIYKSVWGEDSFGNESKVVAYHIAHLRQKLCEPLSNESFFIRCVREIGYSFEVCT